MNGFAILVGLGASLGLWRVSKNVPRWQASRWMNAGLFCLAVSLVGARLCFVLVRYEYFRLHIAEAFQIWQGGLAWPGAVLGALLGLAGICLYWRIHLARAADALIPLLPPIAIAAWMGCWLVGVAYGAQAPEGAWWGVNSLDEGGVWLPRFPLQPLAALTLVIFFAWVETKAPRRISPGLKACIYGLGLALNLLCFSLLRADPSPAWRGYRLDTWAALALFLFCLLGCFSAVLAQRKTLALLRNY